MVTLEVMNSMKRKQLNWSNDDDVPTKMPDGSNIPANFYGMNLDTGILYYWNSKIKSWKVIGGEI